MSCAPSYSFRPTDRPSPPKSAAKIYSYHKSRAWLGGTFFRSKIEGFAQNDISLEATILTTPDPNLISGQTATSYVGRFSKGSGYQIGNTITLSNGSTITVTNVDEDNDFRVTNFIVNSSGTSFIRLLHTMTLTGSGGSGSGFSLTPIYGLSTKNVLDPPTNYEIKLYVSVRGILMEIWTVNQIYSAPPPHPWTFEVDGPCSGGVSALRSIVNENSNIIEMETRGIDFFDCDGGVPECGTFDAHQTWIAAESDGTDPEALEQNCLERMGSNADYPLEQIGWHSFHDTHMTGGEGLPYIQELLDPDFTSMQELLDSIFTDHQRSMIIMDTEESRGLHAMGGPLVNGKTAFPVTPPPSRRAWQYNGLDLITFCNLIQGNCPLDGGCTP